MAVQVIGSINVDLIQSVAALPRPGETVIARSSIRLPGGKGANQAVAAARFGASVRFAGAIGGDDGGQWMTRVLHEEGIDTAAIASLDGKSTGLALIAVDAEGENQIIVSPGANAEVSADMTSQIASDVNVVLAQQEIPPTAILAGFAASRGKALSMFNAAPAAPEASHLLDEADLIIVNQHELAEYLGSSSAPANIEEALSARQLLRRADQIAIVTLGAGGAVAVWQDRHFHAPAFPVTPVDTIGAGDCFCGALASLLDAGQPLETALPLANAAAALCTQTQGAIPALPTRSTVDAFVSGQQVART